MLYSIAKSSFINIISVVINLRKLYFFCLTSMIWGRSHFSLSSPSIIFQTVKNKRMPFGMQLEHDTVTNYLANNGQLIS